MAPLSWRREASFALPQLISQGKESTGKSATPSVSMKACVCDLQYCAFAVQHSCMQEAIAIKQKDPHKDLAGMACQGSGT